MKIANMIGVREHEAGAAVELWQHHASGRLVVRSHADGFSYTDVDLLDLLEWMAGKVGQDILRQYR